MYRLSYYNFEKKKNDRNPGYDLVRKKQIGVIYLFKLRGYKLKHFEEAYSSVNWIVRIYKVKDRQNRDQIEMQLQNDGG